MDAPERIWVDDWNDVCRKPSVCGVEYVRADLYEFMRGEFDRVRKKVAALEQERNAAIAAIDRIDSPDPVLIDYCDKLKAELAALERERDEAQQNEAEWARRGDRSQEDNARLREAIAELADEYDATYHDQLIAGSVVMRLRALAEEENDGR